jgi:hypothetical protein
MVWSVATHELIYEYPLIKYQPQNRACYFSDHHNCFYFSQCKRLPMRYYSTVHAESSVRLSIGMSQAVLPSLLPHFFGRDARATISKPISSPTYCRLRYRQSSTLATRHYNFDRTYSMSTPMKLETFPLEVWLRILDFSTPEVHRAASQLSSAFHQISRKRLYDTIVFGNQVYLGVTRDTAYGATWCRDLKLFHKLHKGRDDWKPYVRRVYVQCCKLLFFVNDVFCETRLSAAIW